METNAAETQLGRVAVPLSSHEDLFPYGRVLLAFMLLSTVAIVAMSLDFRPPPVYEEMAEVPATEEAAAAFFAGEPVEMRFDAPGPDIQGIYFPRLCYHPKHRVQVRLLTGQGEEIGKDVLFAGKDEAHLPPRNEAGQPVTLEIQWLKGRMPALDLAKGIRVGSSKEGGLVHSVPVGGVSLREGQAVDLEFTAPMADLDGVDASGVVPGDLAHVRIELLNLETGKLVKKFIVEEGGKRERLFEPANAQGDRMVLRLTWVPLARPNLRDATSETLIPFRVVSGNQELDLRPVFILRYVWPTRHLFWLWLTVPVAVGWFWRKGTHEWVVMLLLGLCCLTSSVLAWQQTYDHMSYHIDPDGFGEYGERLADYLVKPETREETHQFFYGYRYTYLPLVPLLLSIPRLLGVSLMVSYPLITGWCGFGILLLLRRLIRRGLGLPERVAVLSVLLMGTHDVFLRSFAKPGTDELGILIVIWMLYLLLRRLHEVSLMQTVCLAASWLLIALTRPPGFVFGPFIVGAALWCDWMRTGQLSLSKRILTGVAMALPPLAVGLGLYALFNWFHNFNLSLQTAADGYRFSTIQKFSLSMAGIFQWIPVFWILGAGALRKWKAWLPLAGWAGYFTALLIGVKAAFVHRLFLPVFPSIFGVTALTLEPVLNKRPRVCLCLVAAFCVINVAALWYTVTLPFLPPQPLTEVIY